MMEPFYLETYKTGLLRKKVERSFDILKSCVLCPRMCKVNRAGGETGVCKTGIHAVVSSFDAHFGEESPLVGQHGSGTIFFTHCNLLCLFCQNFEISHEGSGEPVTDEALAAMMVALQNHGCHNINFVTPSHVVPQILSALEIAIENGLHIPLVYNTSGYDLVSTLKLLEGVIDIYMPDFKFWDPALAQAACNAPDYPQKACDAISEMHRQVGDLMVNDRGIAEKGLLIRHLVMPCRLADTREILRFIARKISLSTYVNVMPQYRPCGRAHEIKGFNRRITVEEYQEALSIAKEEGLLRMDRRGRVFGVW
jgi:putative pyruvate formate lyase activating enzyme